MMKRTYKKPMFAAELFVLNQSIALDCGTNIPKDQLTFNDVDNCVWELGGEYIVFIVGNSCSIEGSQMGIECYNNPTDENRIFRS